MRGRGSPTEHIRGTSKRKGHARDLLAQGADVRGRQRLRRQEESKHHHLRWSAVRTSHLNFMRNSRKRRLIQTPPKNSTHCHRFMGENQNVFRCFCCYVQKHCCNQTTFFPICFQGRYESKKEKRKMKKPEILKRGHLEEGREGESNRGLPFFQRMQERF